MREAEGFTAKKPDNWKFLGRYHDDYSFVYFRCDNPLESICYSYLSQAPNCQH